MRKITLNRALANPMSGDTSTTAIRKTAAEIIILPNSASFTMNRFSGNRNKRTTVKFISIIYRYFPFISILLSMVEFLPPPGTAPSVLLTLIRDYRLLYGYISSQIVLSGWSISTGTFRN
jgi:hypothetical protein